MKYFTKEKVVSEFSAMNAGTKAREDINVIMEANGWKAIELVNIRDEKSEKTMGKLHKLAEHRKIAGTMDKAFHGLKKGDTLLIQFPLLSHTIFGIRSIRRLKRRGVKVVLLIHDLEIIRIALGKKSLLSTLRINIEEKSLLKACDKIIVHNASMKKTLMSMGLQGEKMLELQIFDYLIPAFEENTDKTAKDKPVIVAGNLRKNKAGYLYKLSDTQEYNLYGIGYEPERKNDALHYIGAFDPDDLPKQLEGSFGLIWDGDAVETCSGIFGEYLKINNPHKTSLYLASGIPVVIWKQAALASFIQKHECGIVVDSLTDIPTVIAKLSEEDYLKMKKNCLLISEQMRSGYYTLKAISKI